MSKNAVEDFLGMQVTQFPTALCREFGPDLFFSDVKSQIEKAKMICSFCPHSDPCREQARARDERHGVFGGEDEDERRYFSIHGSDKHPRYSPVRDLREMGLSVNEIAKRLNIQHDSVTMNLRRAQR